MKGFTMTDSALLDLTLPTPSPLPALHEARLRKVFGDAEGITIISNLVKVDREQRLYIVIVDSGDVELSLLFYIMEPATDRGEILVTPGHEPRLIRRDGVPVLAWK
jgi:hypothetical protein